jgi:hypothetical protein
MGPSHVHVVSVLYLTSGDGDMAHKATSHLEESFLYSVNEFLKFSDASRPDSKPDSPFYETEASSAKKDGASLLVLLLTVVAREFDRAVCEPSGEGSSSM